jgi:NADH:ubiquinone oxidoreductase subunit D
VATLFTSQLIFRHSLGSACQTALISLASFETAILFAEVVIAVGSIDLVVGELDR